MIIFCDTNVVVDLLEDRDNAEAVQRILETAGEGNEFYISAGSFFTLAFLLERFFKQKGFHQPDVSDLSRKALRGVLRIFQIANIERTDFEASLDDLCFNDIEDSCQYQAALACGADILLTINYKDFKQADQADIHIVTPADFVEEMGYKM